MPPNQVVSSKELLRAHQTILMAQKYCKSFNVKRLFEFSLSNYIELNIHHQLGIEKIHKVNHLWSGGHPLKLYYKQHSADFIPTHMYKHVCRHVYKSNTFVVRLADFFELQTIV